MSPEQDSELRDGCAGAGGLPPEGGACPLRVGVLLDGWVVPGWVAKLVRDIQASDCLRLAVAVLGKSPDRSLGQRFGPRAWSTALFRLYEAADYRLFKGAVDALAPTTIRAELSGVEVIELGGDATGPGRLRQEADGARLRSADLDVLLDLGRGTGRQALAECARYGIWSLHHGTEGGRGGEPPLFWEIQRRQVVAATEVRVETGPGDGGRALCRSFSRPNLLSLYLSRNGVYWKSASLLMCQLRRLYRDGWDALRPPESAVELGSASAAGTRWPGNLTMARFFAGALADLTRRWTDRLLYRSQWLLALRPRSAAGSLLATAQGFRLIAPSRECFYADPFLIKKGGTNYLFCEEYPYATRKGVISCLEIDPQGHCGEPRVVLERDYHLSYPFVFEWQGQFYLLPETGANRTLELYRAVEFPHRWELAHLLMDNVRALDATLLEHQGKFWLFFNPRLDGHPDCEELEAFFADSPLGPWTPHPQNPLVSDVRRARPAGRFFRVNGKLFRPSQDCSVRYGYAVWLNRVDVLSETDYHETPVGRIEPDWLPGNQATHTYNQNEDFEVLDARVLVPKRWLRWLLPSRGACPHPRLGHGAGAGAGLAPLGTPPGTAGLQSLCRPSLPELQGEVRPCELSI